MDMREWLNDLGQANKEVKEIESMIPTLMDALGQMKATTVEVTSKVEAIQVQFSRFRTTTMMEMRQIRRGFAIVSHISSLLSVTHHRLTGELRVLYDGAVGVMQMMNAVALMKAASGDPLQILSGITMMAYSAGGMIAKAQTNLKIEMAERASTSTAQSNYELQGGY